jgi:hypothetical protein
VGGLEAGPGSRRSRRCRLVTVAYLATV